MSTAVAAEATTDEKKWKMIDARIRRRGNSPDALIEVLHAVQEAFGYLEPDVLEYVGNALGVPPSRVYGVATFYSLFMLKPQGEHTCIVCTGTACYINHATALLDRIHERLGIRPGETSADGTVSLLTARCLGACSMAPAMVVDGSVQGRIDPRGRRPRAGRAEVMTDVAEREGTPPRRTEPVRACANVCEAAGCVSLDAEKVFEALSARITERGLTDLAVKRVGCLRLCATGPLVEIPERGKLFEHVDPNSPESIDSVVAALDGGEGGRPTADDPFFSRQMRIVLANSGLVDPEDIDDYVAHGGYEALTQAVTTMRPYEVLEEIVHSGLRGRGGAGYPTGLKWQTVAKASSADVKYVICNADEGDPGAFMDRSVLESVPQQVLEGMAIAGYAVGASHGYIYVRAEYPLAVKRLRLAIRQAERANMLGSNIADTSFSFDIDIRIGAGAFVCGEETALIASVEGRRGTPRPRPPFPAQSGLWEKPTLINNVETFANVAADHPQGRRLVPRPSAQRRAPAPRSSPWPAGSSTPA